MKTARKTAIQAIAFAWILLLAPAMAVALDDFHDDDLWYHFEYGSVTRVYVDRLHNGSATHITIPSTVVYEYTDYENGQSCVKHRTCQVAGIGNWAFNGCSGLTSVTISDGVPSIGDAAFWGCSGLASVTIGGSVTYIGDFAFRDCVGLTSVTIPDSVTTIKRYAFNGCSGLTSVTIPDSVTSIGEYTFSGCSGLASVMLGGSVTSIGDSAFRDCVDLTRVTIPDSVTSIGDWAFYGCSGLESVTIPDSVTSIGRCAFADCVSLTDVAIPGSVTSIGSGVFSCCVGLTDVTIGNGMTSIGGCMFEWCTSLARVTIPDSVTIIEGYAFYGCPSLTNITIPDSVTSIGERAFASNDEFPEEEFHIYSGLASVTIGNSVTQIWDEAFYFCTNLTSVIIPASVKYLGDSAFGGCSTLADVSFKGAPPSSGGWTFSCVAQGARGHYEPEYAEAWKAVIDPATGMWEGLIFQDPVPELRVDSANPAEGSLTLAWDDSASGEGVTYSVYRSGGNSYSAEDLVTNGLTATSWTDTNYWAAEPVLNPLNYWVVAEGGGYEKRESEPVETRHRHGVFVGLADYDPCVFPEMAKIQSCVDDATIFRDLFVERGGCPAENAKLHTMPNDTKLERIRGAMHGLATNTTNGDFAVVYFDTHGSEKDGLCAYDGHYTAQMLSEDLKKIPAGVSVLCVIGACHSESMFNGGDADPFGHGYAGACPANVAFLSASSFYETASGNWFRKDNGQLMSELTTFLLHFGWDGGFADTNGRDGMVTVKEAIHYAERMVHGGSDKINPAHPFSQIPQGVAGIALGTAGAQEWDGEVSPPRNLTATDGSRTDGIALEWEEDENAFAYHVYRAGYPLGEVSTAPDLSEFECIAYWYSREALLDKLHTADFSRNIYYVVSASPAGTSGPSNFAIGDRKTEIVDFSEWMYSVSEEGNATVERGLIAEGPVEIPPSLGGSPVTAIGDYAFCGNAGLTSVVIPGSVMNVGANAFAGCSALATLNVPAEWEGTDMLAAAGVPEGCEVVYGGVVRQTVHFDANGGTSKKASVTCAVGGKYSGFPTATWENHVFQGWYDDPEGGNRVRIGMEVTAVAERTLYAHWKKQTVHFDANGGRSKKESVTCYVGGTYSGFPACTWENHVFQGWYDDPEGGSRVKNGMQVTADSERTLYAHWKRQTVRFDANGGTCKKKSVTCYVGGTYTTLASASWDGRKFLGWYDAPTGGNRVKLGMEVTADAERTLYAHWEQTIRFDGNGGTIKKASVTCVIGETYTTLASAKWDGRKFLGWYDAPTGGNRVKLGMDVTADAERTLYAHWEQTVRFDGNGGTCSKTTATYIIGETYSGFKTATRNGFTFKGWYTAKEGGARVKNGMTVTADAERTLYAHWQAAAASLSITGFSRSTRPGPAARDARTSATECTLQVEAPAGVSYEIQWTPTLSGDWTALKRWAPAADGETSVPVVLPADSPAGFFRLVGADAE